MPRSRIFALPRSLMLLPLIVAGGCYQDPNKQLDAMQETVALQSTIEDLGNRTTELQFALDSLRTVVARQDTTIRALANLAGVRYAP